MCFVKQSVRVTETVTVNVNVTVTVAVNLTSRGVWWLRVKAHQIIPYLSCASDHDSHCNARCHSADIRSLEM